MSTIDDVLQKIENKNSSEVVIDAYKVIQAINEIAPKFEKMKGIVERSLGKIAMAETEQPKMVEQLNKIMLAEGNVERLDKVKDEVNGLKSQYQKHLDILESQGLGFISKMTPNDMKQIVDKISEHKEIRRSIDVSLKEFGMDFEDLPTLAKKAILSTPKKNSLKI